MSAASVDLLSAIQDSIRKSACRGRDHEPIGPFLATFNRDDANPFLNYAVPDDGAEPTPDDVARLVEAYEARGRRPRLEYVPLVAPAVEPTLLAAGFAAELRTPLMTCGSPEDVREPQAHGVELFAPRREDDYRGAAAVQWEAYEEEGDVPQRAVDSLRRTAEGGGVVVVARDLATGEAAGAGLCTIAEDGLTELTSVGVRPSFRRRGIAAAMTGWLARRAFESGVSGVFLMAHGKPEERIYARAGFTTRSEVLHISRP